MSTSPSQHMVPCPYCVAFDHLLLGADPDVGLETWSRDFGPLSANNRPVRDARQPNCRRCCHLESTIADPIDAAHLWFARALVDRQPPPAASSIHPLVPKSMPVHTGNHGTTPVDEAAIINAWHRSLRIVHARWRRELDQLRSERTQLLLQIHTLQTHPLNAARANHAADIDENRAGTPRPRTGITGLARGLRATLRRIAAVLESIRLGRWRRGRLLRIYRKTTRIRHHLINRFRF